MCIQAVDKTKLVYWFSLIEDEVENPNDEQFLAFTTTLTQLVLGTVLKRWETTPPFKNPQLKKS